MPSLPPEYVIAEGLAHPLRLRILAALNGGEASPLELAEAMGMPLTHVSYHVRRLQECGLIAQTRTQQKRGAIQHFYKLTVHARIDARLVGSST